MMKISILGAGRVGANLGRALAEKGHDVVLGVLDPKAHERHWEGPKVQHASLFEAAAASPLVIHATPGASALQTLTALRAPLEGKVLLDVSNATERTENGLPGGLCYPGESLSEKIQAALPGTRVVKSLNTMLFMVMTNPHSLATPPTAFISGNHEGAKADVAQLLRELGWPDAWIMDLGGIESARATEALILMVPHVIKRVGFVPFAVSVAR